MTATVCRECGTHPVPPGRETCDTCRDAFLAGIHRRKETELRLPPITSARHLQEVTS